MFNFRICKSGNAPTTGEALLYTFSLKSTVISHFSCSKWKCKVAPTGNLEYLETCVYKNIRSFQNWSCILSESPKLARYILLRFQPYDAHRSWNILSETKCHPSTYLLLLSLRGENFSYIVTILLLWKYKFTSAEIKYLMILLPAQKFLS